MESRWKNFHDSYKVLQSKIVATAVKFQILYVKSKKIQLVFKKFFRQKLRILFLEEKYVFRAEEMLNASVIL